MSEHTGLPWEVGHELSEGFSIVHEIAPNCGQLQFIAICGTDPIRFGAEIARDVSKANARLIVRAVNNHGRLERDNKRLVEALKSMATYLDAIVSLKAVTGPCIDSRRNEARAALKQATEE